MPNFGCAHFGEQIDILQSYGLKRRTLSVSASTNVFAPRTLADVRTEDAKYHSSNLNYKLDKRSSAGICVACAALWDACCSFASQALGFGSMMAVLRGPAMPLT